MKTRIKYGTLAFLFFLPFVLLGGIYFAFLVLFLALIGMYELTRMANIPINNVVGVIGVVAIALIVLPNKYLPVGLNTLSPIYFFYFLCLLLLILTVFYPQHVTFTSASIIILGGIYIGSGFHFFIYIRDIGLEVIMYLLLVIWMTDIGAFFIGSLLGKRKLAPNISPNKTIEGFIGGIIVSLIASNVLFLFVDVPIPTVVHRWILTIMLSAFGQLGDLVESAYKRNFGVKDSGHLIPGHGGVLDRFDSTLFASIMFMVWLNIF